MSIKNFKNPWVDEWKKGGKFDPDWLGEKKALETVSGKSLSSNSSGEYSPLELDERFGDSFVAEFVESYASFSLINIETGMNDKVDDFNNSLIAFVYAFNFRSSLYDSLGQLKMELVTFRTGVSVSYNSNNDNGDKIPEQQNFFTPQMPGNLSPTPNGMDMVRNPGMGNNFNTLGFQIFWKPAIHLSVENSDNLEFAKKILDQKDANLTITGLAIFLKLDLRVLPIY